jgi:hypothetical protein
MSPFGDSAVRVVHQTLSGFWTGIDAKVTQGSVTEA